MKLLYRLTRNARRGDNWDHVALDAEHKLVLEVVNGKRTKANTKPGESVQELTEEVHFNPKKYSIFSE